MKKELGIKLILLIILLSAFRQIYCQSSLDTINWAYHQKQGCTEIQQLISKLDPSATAHSMIEACRCAIKLKNGILAQEYITQAEFKGYKNVIVIDILKIRSHVLLDEDQKAVQILKDLSKKIDIYTVMMIPEISELRQRNAEALEIYHACRPAFDYFTFIIAAICFLGYFVGLLFFLKSLKCQQMKWLGLFVVNFSVIMTSFVLYWTKFNGSFPYLNEWWHPLYLVIGPIFYFYIKSITGTKNSIGNRILNLVPFIFCTSIFAYNGLFFQFAYGTTNPGFLISVLQSMPIKLLSLGLYFVLSGYLFKGDWLVDPYVKKWMLYLFTFFGIFLMANIVYYLCTFWDGFNKDWDYGISAVMSLGIIGVATMGFLESKYLSFHPAFISDPMPKEHVKEPIDVLPDISSDLTIKKYKSSTLTSSAASSVKIKLEKLMTENRLYQREDLRLQDIADMIGLHRNQVSQVINENYNLNFFEWINRYRIHYAADLLSTPNCPYTISQVGFESGFNNKVSFYKSFRQYFQCTPLEYVARLERERAKMS